MIPLKPQPEPPGFGSRVGNPGREFLVIFPNPTAGQWKANGYWQRALPDMRGAYRGMCAYCAQWIPHATGGHSIDHFIPKSKNPSLAYEWSNFRYVSSRFNSRKGVRSILDPFTLREGWFRLDTSSCLVKPKTSLPREQKNLVLNTIKILKLNDDEDLVEERKAWIEEYRKGEITFEHLEKRAPFIAFEFRRQHLVEETERKKGDR